MDEFVDRLLKAVPGLRKFIIGHTEFTFQFVYFIVEFALHTLYPLTHLLSVRVALQAEHVDRKERERDHSMEMHQFIYRPPADGIVVPATRHFLDGECMDARLNDVTRNERCDQRQTLTVQVVVHQGPREGGDEDRIVIHHPAIIHQFDHVIYVFEDEIDKAVTLDAVPSIRTEHGRVDGDESIYKDP